MPKITDHAKIFRDWDGLLGAVEANAGLLPGVDDLKAGMEKILADGRAAKVQQASLGSTRQATTQNIHQILADGKEMARKLRGFVLSHLGTRTDLTKQFGLPVVRKPKKKAKETPPPAKPAAATGTEAHPATAPQNAPPAAPQADGVLPESHRTVK